MKQTIELRKLRDFGQVITDTFTFFKENFKPLLRSLLVICGVFLLISTVSAVAVYMNMASAFSFRQVNSYDFESHTMSYYVSLIINGMVSGLMQLSIQLVSVCYIAVYLQNNKAQPSLAQVWGYFKYYFWRVLGATFLLGMLAALACPFCLVPGIYLGVVFSLAIPIIVIENASFRYAFNKSFRLIRNNWWATFGVIFVMYIILGIGNGVASLPLSLITVFARFITIKTLILPMVIFFTILQHLLITSYSLISISVTLCYFNLSEEKEGAGILDRIENFGKRTDENPGIPAEEY